MTTQLTMVGAEVAPSTSDEWNTPAEVLAPVYRLWPDGIGLDPCSGPLSIVESTDRYMPPRDGLELPWFGTVFCNPPYSDPGPWLSRCLDHSLRGEAIALVKHDHTTHWWRSWVRGSPVCLWHERIRFRGAKRHAAPWPSAVVYYGRRMGAFAEQFRRHGSIVIP